MANSDNCIAAVGVPFHEVDDALEALLVKEETKDDVKNTIKRSMLTSLQQFCFIFGIFLGFFVECGALAAHILYQSIRWKDTAPTTKEVVFISFLWATATSVLPCVALLFIRTIIISSYDLVALGNDSALTNPRLQTVLWQIESRFGVGSFFGVSLSAAMIDKIMGLNRHLVLTGVLVVTACLTYVIFLGSPEVLTAESGVTLFENELEIQLQDSEETEDGPIDIAQFRNEEQLLPKRLDCVDPSAMHAVELKHGSLVIV